MKIPKINRINLMRTGAHTLYRNSYHIVFTTKYREPYLNPLLKIQIRNCLREKFEELNADLIIMNGYRDHMHILANLPLDLSVSRFVRHVKGFSSRMLGKDRYWQKGYFSEHIDPLEMPGLIRYIRNQYHLHRKKIVVRQFEFRAISSKKYRYKKAS